MRVYDFPGDRQDERSLCSGEETDEDPAESRPRAGCHGVCHAVLRLSRSTCSADRALGGRRRHGLGHAHLRQRAGAGAQGPGQRHQPDRRRRPDRPHLHRQRPGGRLHGRRHQPGIDLLQTARHGRSHARKLRPVLAGFADPGRRHRPGRQPLQNHPGLPEGRQGEPQRPADGLRHWRGRLLAYRLGRPSEGSRYRARRGEVGAQQWRRAGVAGSGRGAASRRSPARRSRRSRCWMPGACAPC